MLENRRIFITGGAGFIGTSLCSHLHEHNQILLYDSLHRNSIKFTSLLSKDNIRLIEGDVLDFDHLNRAVEEFRPDIVIHLAAIAGIDTVVRSPVTTMKVNVLGIFNLLESLKPFVNNVERFVNFSTSEVFGTYAYKVSESQTTNLAPVGEARWIYSVSKLAGEHFAYANHRELGLRAVSLRPFNIYGPGQVGEGAINVFIKRAIRDEPLEIHGDGDQIRSWCYIEDMMQGILLVLEKEEAVGQVFNIGNPRSTITILSLAEKVIQLANSQSTIVHVPKNYVDVELRIPDIGRAREVLGFNPRVDLNEGVARTIEWRRSHQIL
jgi:UDP-glucuronate decarboxylase